MSRLPQRSARVQPPLRGRSATNPLLQQQDRFAPITRRRSPSIATSRPSTLSSENSAKPPKCKKDMGGKCPESVCNPPIPKILLIAIAMLFGVLLLGGIIKLLFVKSH